MVFLLCEDKQKRKPCSQEAFRAGNALMPQSKVEAQFLTPGFDPEQSPLLHSDRKEMWR